MERMVVKTTDHFWSAPVYGVDAAKTQDETFPKMLSCSQQLSARKLWPSNITKICWFQDDNNTATSTIKEILWVKSTILGLFMGPNFEFWLNN